MKLETANLPVQMMADFQFCQGEVLNCNQIIQHVHSLKFPKESVRHDVSRLIEARCEASPEDVGNQGHFVG